MNYTADTNDAEHLAGPSPWGSSSPKADRISFPPSPTPAPQQPLYPDQQGSPNASRYHDVSDRSHQQNASAAVGDDADAPIGSQHHQSMPAGHAEEGDQPPHQSGPQPAQQQRQGVARYQTARQQRTVPQYKLQAKVTALERSGRKDPVLRFDVYVWVLHLL